MNSLSCAARSRGTMLKPAFDNQRRIDMGRAGRKRKSGRRHPSGGLVQEKKPDDRIRTSRQPGRRDVRHEDRLSEHAESPLGRLYLRGRITEPMRDAGTRYSIVVSTYRSTIAAPASTSGSGGRSRCLAEEASTADACKWDPDNCRCLRKKQDYDDAYAAVCSVGQRAAKVVARVAVHQDEIAPEDFVYLTVGLNALVRHFGLTDRR